MNDTRTDNANTLTSPLTFVPTISVDSDIKEVLFKIILDLTFAIYFLHKMIVINQSISSSFLFLII